MKKKIKIVATCLLALIVLSWLTGCTSNVSAKRNRNTDDLFSQWQDVNDQFQKVIEAVDSKAEGRVELRVLELDSKGFPKKYEFVGFKDDKEFLVYDSEGELKE